MLDIFFMSVFFFSQFKVPKDFTFRQVLDLFYKVHKVFHVPFHAHLQQVMAFFGAFIYDNKDDERFMTAKTSSFKHIIIEQQPNQNSQLTRRPKRRQNKQKDPSFEYADDK